MALYFLYSTVFFLDLAFAFVCATRWLFGMLCIYYIQAFTQASWRALLVPGFLILLETFIYTSCLGVDLAVMVPLTLMIFALKNYIHQDKLLIAFGAGICFLVHLLIIYHGFFGRSISSLLPLKSSIIHGILIITVCYLVQGSQGNRL